MKRLSSVALALTFVLAACSVLEPAETPISNPTPLPITPQFFATETPTPPPDPIYLSIIWDYHQPVYSTDSRTGLITQPWVRVHSTRDYFDMAAMLAKYPKVRATFNFSPVLLRQINDITSGARDIYWELATRPAGSLSDEDRRFILARFFDAGGQQVIDAFPRYRELLDKRDRMSETPSPETAQSFSEQDIRDLQVWFNLATFDPDLLAESPLKDLVAKGRDFSEDDKRTVFDVVLSTLRATIPLYAELQERGQIEVSTSPYAHAILPLLADTDIARTSDPAAQLPDPPFRFEQDVVEQIKRASESYQQLYGRAPRGLVPAGGAVAPNIIKPVMAGGYQWMASGEEVLARSLQREPFARDERGVTRQADALYRPYGVTGAESSRIAMLFGDTLLANRVISTYSAMSAADAAQDFVNQILSIKAGLANENAASPHLITLILDGERVWSNYPDNGQQFVRALYERLSEAADHYEIQTITPSDYLAKFPELRTLDELAPGARAGDDLREQPNFRAWIGAPEQNNAWTYLQRTRTFLDDYLTGIKIADPQALARAYDALLLSEGSDWMYWYGAGLDPAEQRYYDEAFRELLGQVYGSVGVPTPDFVTASIFPASVLSGNQTVQGLITPTIDGVVEGSEWDAAGAVIAPPAANSPVSALYYGLNADSIFFRVDGRDDWSALAAGVDTAQLLRVSVYFARPGATAFSEFTRVGGDGEVRTALGMSATHLLEWTLDTDGSSTTALYAANPDGGWSGTATVFAPGAAVGNVLEMAAPLKSLGGLENNVQVNIIATVHRDGQAIASFPTNGMAQMNVPDIGKPAVEMATPLLSAEDPLGDDHGPGSYTYPTNGVFDRGIYDLKRVEIISDGKSLIFMLALNGPINNVWNSPNGLSVQTFDIYIDKNPGKGTGERKLLEGRNAALAKGNGWEYALWIEGWAQELLTPDGKGGVVTHEAAQLKVQIDPAGVAIIEVPLSALGGGDPATWGYAVAVLSQEAFPADGARRVRDIDPVASQWRFGGAPADTNHTRIIDALVLSQARMTQEAGLSQYVASQEIDVSTLPADSFGMVPLITISR